MKKITSIFAVAFLFVAVQGLEIPNGDFADGLNRWEKQPAGSTVALEDVAGGKVLALGTENANAGVTLLGHCIAEQIHHQQRSVTRIVER